MTSSRDHTVRLTSEFFAHHIEVSEFDGLVDRGIDNIIILTPQGRWVATIDEWYDYGYVDLEDDVDVRVLHRSYMAKF